MAQNLHVFDVTSMQFIVCNPGGERQLLIGGSIFGFVPVTGAAFNENDKCGWCGGSQELLNGKIILLICYVHFAKSRHGLV